jgi:hypothetical protein
MFLYLFDEKYKKFVEQRWHLVFQAGKSPSPTFPKLGKHVNNLGTRQLKGSFYRRFTFSQYNVRVTFQFILFFVAFIGNASKYIFDSLYRLKWDFVKKLKYRMNIL